MLKQRSYRPVVSQVGLQVWLPLDDVGSKTGITSNLGNQAGPTQPTLFNHGVVSSGIAPTWGIARPINGPKGYGISCTNAGTGLPVSVANCGVSTALTFAVWVYLTAYPTSGNYFGVATTSSSNNSLYIKDTTFPAFYGSGGLDPAGSTAIQLNRWTHMAATITGGAVVVYLNGISVATGSFSPSSNANCTLCFGNDARATSRILSGIIDDCRYYTRALSQAEIIQLASEPFIPSYTDAVWLNPFKHPPPPPPAKLLMGQIWM
jgi:hypothetical protein